MRLVALGVAILGVLGVVSAAHAGGTTNGSSESTSSESGSSESSSSESSSGESSSDSGSTDSGSSDTTTDDTSTSSSDDTSTTSDTTGVVDDTTGSSCSCPTGDESIAIDTPTDGADVAAPFAVSVDVQPRCPCFDCACAAEDFEYAQLFVAGLATGGPCYASPCEWSVSPNFLGITEVRATAWYPSGEATTSIDVNVTSLDDGTTTDPSPDPTTAPPPESTDTTGYAGEAPPAGGCGCTGSPADAGAPAHRGAPVLLVVAAFVRRRRRP